LLRRIRRSKDARSNLVASNLDKGIAFQIRATRDKRQITQTELAEAAGMTQNNVSRLESPEYGKHTLSSLKRIADALDVALVVRFVPFSQYIDWLSATPYLDHGLVPESLAVPSFKEEEEQGACEQSVAFFGVIQNIRATNSLTPLPPKSLSPAAPVPTGSYQSSFTAA
jgi:transcriptional regulator with XRE-family HTH domain